VCPFVRNDGNGVVTVGSRSISGPGGVTRTYTLVERRGRYETYHTWLWEDIIRGQIPHGEQHPNDPTEGRPKYSVLSWNKVLTGTPPEIPDALSIVEAAKDPKLMRILASSHRKWSAEDARRRRSPSLSENTVVYCAQGNHMELGYYIWNPTSHTTSAGGGTNVIFADSHVDWVRGTQVGWP
jgi:prepilin-type processing-associated H-X9-DG protein